jgi:hypothetical protein
MWRICFVSPQQCAAPLNKYGGKGDSLSGPASMIETPSFRSRIHQTTSKICRPHPLIEKMILSVEILEPFMLMGASGWFPRIGELFLLILSSQHPLLPWRYCPPRSFFSVSIHHTPCIMFQPLKSILFTALVPAATIQLFSDPGTLWLLLGTRPSYYLAGERWGLFQFQC